MEIGDIQKKVNEFVANYNLETSVDLRILDLVSEVGEVSKEVLKGSCYGKNKFVTTTEWKNEIGDGFFSLICIANSTSINLENV